MGKGRSQYIIVQGFGFFFIWGWFTKQKTSQFYDDDADDDADVDDDAGVDDDADDGHLQVDILLFPEDGLSGFEFPKAHLAQPFLQTVRWWWWWFLYNAGVSI